MPVGGVTDQACRLIEEDEMRILLQDHKFRHVLGRKPPNGMRTLIIPLDVAKTHAKTVSLMEDGPHGHLGVI